MCQLKAVLISLFQESEKLKRYLIRNLCQVNQITHWLDNSNVYGSTDDVARNLRTLSGGILRTEPCRNGRECLPFTGMDNCRGPTKRCGLAGIVCLVYGGKWNNLVFYTILPQSHIIFLDDSIGHNKI